MKPVHAYLQIPIAFAAYYDGLRWSENGDALENSNGTFAMTGEVALFLEGFLSSRRLIHFGYVVHLFGLLGLANTVNDAHSLRLRRLLQEAGGSVRNLGAFAAHVCAAVPSVAEPIDLDRVNRQWVTNNALLSLLGAASEAGSISVTAEALPWAPDIFDWKIRQALKVYSTDELKHWFRHGRGSLQEDGEQLAQELETVRPRTLAGVLATASRRERLHGAVRFVAQLGGVLSLPPRRLSPNELALGGYADVTTRGQPEQLLPSQFALDDLEFVRRFAAKELLYYRREEPHVPLREELVLLLDQGVRTWGEVRLILSAAVFALGKRAAARKVPLKLATTGSDGRLVDPLLVTDDEFGALLEASDLSFHPGLTLERVLEEPTDAARDVVLLTQPINLREPDVAAAACRLLPGTRLFALTVDDRGRSQLAELHHGSAVPLAQFRVDLSVQQSEPASKARIPAVDELPPWHGNVEPLGFPFRFGITSRVSQLAFDLSGEWLLAVSSNGILHAHQADGSLTEVLPRGMLDHQVLTRVEVALAVAGGFVVGGRIESELVAMHYVLAERRCVAHRLGVHEGKPWQWHYLPEFHSVVVRCAPHCFGVDLGTGERAAHILRADPTDSRIARACAAVWDVLVPAPELKVRDHPMRVGIRIDCQASNLGPGERSLIALDDKQRGFVHVITPTDHIYCQQPLADGQPVLRGCRLINAQLCGNTLAIRTFREGEPTKSMLRLLDVQSGALLREFELEGEQRLFTLSADGSRLARLIGPHQVGVYDVVTGGGPVSVTPTGGCHSNLTVELGEDWLKIGVGDRTHLLRWDQGVLELLHWKRGFTSPGGATATLDQVGTLSTIQGPPASWTNAWFWYDRKRFVSWAMAELVVVVDLFGQVALFSLEQELLAMFFVFRDKIAGWLPDGTRFGPASVTGGPATPDALKRIGQALANADCAGPRAGWVRIGRPLSSATPDEGSTEP